MIRHTARPAGFSINTAHSLANGLVFAGLGAIGTGSTHYHDSSIRRNNGTLTNYAPLADWNFCPIIGRWCLTGNSTNKYVSTTTMPGWFENLKTTGGTWAAWVKYTATASRYAVAAVFDSATPTNGFQFNVNSNGPSASAGSIAIAIYGTTGSATSATYTTSQIAALYDGNWHHVAATAQTGLAASTMSIYYDGVAQAVTFSGAGVDSTSALSNAMTVSARNLAGTKGLYFPGSLADVMIYGRALSSAEIAQLADPSNVMLSGLIASPRRRVFAAAAISSRRRRLLCGVQ